MRVPVIAGNWKMHLTPKQGRDLVGAMVPLLTACRGREIVVCPPFTALATVAAGLAGSNIRLGAQNMHVAPEGAFTGEIAAGMLKSLGCTYVILGHSERRQHFFETDDLVAAKTRAALAADLTPIICAGETLTQRENGITRPVVEIQVRGALTGLTPEQLRRVIIAYEPVWAIGTGRTASVTDAQDGCAFIRSVVRALDTGAADFVRILYGGSVKPENVQELMSGTDIDGALVGGASLKADSFARIVRYEEQ